jgi:UDP-N-acetylglucosamine 2-epimerase
MPEEVNRVVADHLSRWLFAPTPTAVANLASEGVTAGVTLVGDLMEDLVARVGPEIREPTVLTGIGRTLGIDLVAGRYCFATIHRAENREPAALRAWAGLLDAVALPDRPIVLALHPGTRDALDREGVFLGAAVRVVPPLGYRSSLALQLHAAAVITDSGGVQRESAWLGTPCLVLRRTTEWVEAVADSDGRVVVVGLDRERAAAELARLAPLDHAEAFAGTRARELDLRSVGAAGAIVAALEGDRGAGRP